MHHVNRLQRIRYRPLQINNASYNTAASPGRLTQPAQPTITGEDGRTLRTRQHGNISLPLPPLLDPILNAKRQRKNDPKPASPANNEPPTAFQQALQANPFAQALATSVRQCVLTRARLPSHFLVPFATNMPAFQKAPVDGNGDSAKPRIVPALHFKSGRPQSYVLGTEATMDILASTGKKGKWQFKWTWLVNERMKRAWASHTARNVDAVNILKEWDCDRENLARQVREELSKNIQRSLRRCVAAEKDSKGSIVVPLPAAEEVYPEKFACILRVKGRESQDAEETQSGMLQYKLDEEDVGELLKDCESCGLGLVKHETTTFLMMDLERLQNFMGRP